MIRRLDLPDAAGAADAAGRLHAPSAARNRDAIAATLLPCLPETGTVLELASGTGQHIEALARARPNLDFQPTEPDPARRTGIDARCAALSNVAPAMPLDACAPGWGAARRCEALILVNLLHLISEAEMAVLLDEAAKAVAPGGLFAIYGPFLRDGMATSPGDAAFDKRLRAQDPAIGYKDDAVVTSVLTVLGFVPDRVEMPANNLMLLARRGGARL